MLFFEGHKVYMNGDYPAVFINGKNQHVHRLQWKKYHGEIPKGFIIHHKDGNKVNWDINNLELLSRSDHVNEHRDSVHRKGVPVIARKDDLVIIFRSIEEASEHCGVFTSAIQRCFKGKQKQSKGWTFERGDHHSFLRF